MKTGRKQSVGKAELKGISVIADMRLGRVSPAQKVAFRRFWAKVISQVKHEISIDEQHNHKSEEKEVADDH